MLARYTRPEMARLWSEENRFHAWWRVELAVLEALAEAGVVPHEDLVVLKRGVRIDPERIAEIEARTRHDTIAFVEHIAEQVGPAGRWVHYGLTSADVVDTAWALLLREASELLLAELDRLLQLLRDMSLAYRGVPVLGRTHGKAAEPTTFGLKLLGFYDELHRGKERLQATARRAARGKIAGPVGAFSHLPPEIEEAALRRLGLEPAPVATQVLPRDTFAEYLAALALLGTSLEHLAVEMRHLARSEVEEVEEGFSPGQKGSSAMPHKRNPVGFENVSGLARLLRGYMLAAFENVPLWHERDISHSSVERVIFPDATTVLHYMLWRMCELLAHLKVVPERMRENLRRTGGLFASSLLLDLYVAQGIRREDAYARLQELAFRALEGPPSFLRRILEDSALRAAVERVFPEVASGDEAEAEERLFDALVRHFLRHESERYRRVFGTTFAEKEA